LGLVWARARARSVAPHPPLCPYAAASANLSCCRRCSSRACHLRCACARGGPSIVRACRPSRLHHPRACQGRAPSVRPSGPGTHSNRTWDGHGRASRGSDRYGGRLPARIPLRCTRLRSGMSRSVTTRLATGSPRRDGAPWTSGRPWEPRAMPCVYSPHQRVPHRPGMSCRAGQSTKRSACPTFSSFPSRLLLR
jgi:hypothetical protein